MNIVLIGMPSSGRSTVGVVLAKAETGNLRSRYISCADEEDERG